MALAKSQLSLVSWLVHSRSGVSKLACEGLIVRIKKAISGIWYSSTLVTFANKLHSNKAKQNATKSVAGLANARLFLWRYVCTTNNMELLMDLDSHGQPVNRAFNFSRNKEKAVYGLKGILSGIVADKRLTELELLFLDIWLKEQSVLKNDGDVIDLLDLIGETLMDGIVTPNELKELHSLADDIIEYKETGFAESESQINEFVGLLSGVAADNSLNDLEILKLLSWFKENEDVERAWPINVIAEKLHLALEDNIITLDEREHLLKVMKQITGIRFEESGIAYGMATDFFEDDIDNLVHENSTFCFTGTFVSGTRGVVQNTAKNKGAIIKNNVTKNLDYLVIGTLASRDWRYSTHGRKIEKALSLKSLGKPIIIINERTWLKHT